MLILWKGKETPDDRPYGFFAAHRWVFYIEKWEMGWELQGKHKTTGEWKPATYYYMVSVNYPLDWGSFHSYYDGPHCGFSLGPIHLNWTGNPRTGWCKKCMPD